MPKKDQDGGKNCQKWHKFDKFAKYRQEKDWYSAKTCHLLYPSYRSERVCP